MTNTLYLVIEMLYVFLQRIFWRQSALGLGHRQCNADNGGIGEEMLGPFEF